MKVEKVLSRLNQAPEAVEELRAAGQALGDELPRRRLDVLRVPSDNYTLTRMTIRP